MGSSRKDEVQSWLATAVKVGLLVLRDRQSRRKLMFYITLAAMIQLGFGVLILHHLAGSLILFVLYWGFCLVLVCIMVLLAMYDMLAVRQEQKAELKRLREKIFSEEDQLPSQNDDS